MGKYGRIKVDPVSFETTANTAGHSIFAIGDVAVSEDGDHCHDLPLGALTNPLLFLNNDNNDRAAG